MSFYKLHANLIHEIDCIKNDGDDYFESHPTMIRETECGTYRECSPIRWSRFAYKFEITKIQKPHVIVFSFPDDKKRTFCVMDGRTYDISMGIATGREIPISGKMLQCELIFWPRWTNCTIMFASWDENAPAASSRIEIYELNEDAFSFSGGLKKQEGYRKIGFQWEDPCTRFMTIGAFDGKDWSTRIAEYAASIKQNVIVYPLSWYWGCLYPSEIDATDYLESLVDRQSNSYMNALSTTYDWVAETIEALGRYNIDFIGSFQTYRFYKLLQTANSDRESVYAGKYTINNITFDGNNLYEFVEFRTFSKCKDRQNCQ